jgi:hypothetical protein
MKRRQGFVFLVALSILAILGALVWSLTTWCGMQARASMHEAAEAQLRQLLLAGLQVTPAALDAGQEHQVVALPEETQEMGVEITVLTHTSAEAMVRVEARCAARTTSEQARFVRAGGRWVLERMVAESEESAPAQTGAQGHK